MAELQQSTPMLLYSYSRLIINHPRSSQWYSSHRYAIIFKLLPKLNYLQSTCFFVWSTLWLSYLKSIILEALFSNLLLYCQQIITNYNQDLENKENKSNTCEKALTWQDDSLFCTVSLLYSWRRSSSFLYVLRVVTGHPWN